MILVEANKEEATCTVKVAVHQVHFTKFNLISSLNGDSIYEDCVPRQELLGSSR